MRGNVAIVIGASAGIAKHHGHLFKHTGEGVAAVFASAADACAAAADSQARLRDVLPVRMGLHTGEAELRDGDYFGSTLNRCARLMSIGDGGQILLSNATGTLVMVGLPGDTDLFDLGVHRLPDLARPERIFQLRSRGARSDFPPLRSLDYFPGELPIVLTSFVGRERELQSVVDASAKSRIVTVIGVGGVGKTRLALQAAAEMLPGFADGAWFCELASIADRDAVPEAVATCLAVTQRSS